MERNQMKLYTAISNRSVTDHEEKQQNQQLHRRHYRLQQQYRPSIRSVAVTKQMHQTTPSGLSSLRTFRSFSSIAILPTPSPSSSLIFLSTSPSASNPSRSSPDISAQGLIVLLLLFTSPMISLGLHNDHTPHHMATTVSVAVSCHRHFNRRVQECLDPFTSLLDVYDRHADKLMGDETSSKHLCLEYKMVLLCLHSALTDCPTLHYVKRVQRKLSSHWVIRVNKLCAIQSNQVEQGVSRQYDSTGSTSGTHAHPYSEYSTNDFGSQSLTNRRGVYKSNKNTKAELMRSMVDTRNNREYRNSDFSDFLQDSQEDNDSSDPTEGSEIVFNLVKLVQNFNYQTQTEHGKRMANDKHSSETVSDNSAFQNFLSLQLWILCVSAIILALQV